MTGDTLSFAAKVTAQSLHGTEFYTIRAVLEQDDPITLLNGFRRGITWTLIYGLLTAVMMLIIACH